MKPKSKTILYACTTCLCAVLSALAGDRPPPQPVSAEGALNDVSASIDAAIALTEKLDTALDKGQHNAAEELLRKLQAKLRNARRALDEAADAGGCHPKSKALSVSAPNRIDGSECHVEISGLVRAPQRVYYLAVLPTLSAGSAYVQEGEILIAEDSRVVYLGTSGELDRPETYKICLISAPRGAITLDGEKRISEFDSQDIHVEACVKVERTR